MMQAEDQGPKPQPQPEHRYDGIAKVTGTAKYAAEFKEPFPKRDLLYAFVVQSTIPNGTVTAMDTTAAERAPGVAAVLTPFNAPKLPVGPPKPPAKRSLTVLQNNEVRYNGQPIAVVVARSLPEAREAVGMLQISYAEEPAKLDFRGRLHEARPPKQPGKEPAKQGSGDLAAAMSRAAVRTDNTYVTPIQNHNPMEPHATVAWWEGEKLNVYDATQYISGDRMSLANVFNLALDNVRVMCPYVGGGFGSKGSSWSHVVLAAMAARIVQKPVQLALDRQQMFGPVGARPSTVNRIQMAAGQDGKLAVLKQDVVLNASVLEDFVEHAESPARKLYAAGAIETTVGLVEVNYGVSTFMRAPGEAPGTAVLEMAMDELAEKLKMDPVELRLANYAERDPVEDKPWSSKHLRECYLQAGERFGWSKRSATPGQRVEGNSLIGYGMATATYPANRSAAQAVARFLPDGKVIVGSGTQDLGTGMYTIMAQTAAQELGIEPLTVEVKLGDSTLPKAPVSGGSQSAASVCPAVQEACKQLKLKAAAVALGDPKSPLHGAADTDVEVKGGKICLKSDGAKGEAITALIARNGGKAIEAQGSAEPGQEKSAMTEQSFGAVFAEVAVDRDTHMVKVRRVVATYDIGTLMNQKTGLNQLMGGIVWGVGFALHEETHIDPKTGRTVNENLAEYHVPVNADIGTIDVTVLNIADTKFNPLGARGIGEIGITGAAAAVANAIYNATGKR
ncbi:MAG TPA: xanthine dehydrogenase family protein molybdopterin-binding subunit, partial [Acidobacteriaceae bacterium]|nr:xanthine dehydrogenase family protein molybdopterin-binding subunit [Acidobacteriaceae bacterium]